MRVLILHNVGELLTQIGLFNHPKEAQGEILPWENEHEVSELQHDYDFLKFTTNTKPPAEPSETNYSVKKDGGSNWWKGTFKNTTGKKETEGECTCFIFE